MDKQGTLFELGTPDQKPIHHEGEQPRLARQEQAILEALRTGPKTNVQLAAMALKYTSRVSSLRQSGHVIECTNKGGGTFMYTLKQ